jgi:predicted tellurium resistance membrane protein TerC
VAGATLSSIILDIVIDIVFPPDSIITAVGMVDNVRAMIAAMLVPVRLREPCAREAQD